MSGMNAVLRYGKQLLTSYGVTIFVTVVGTLAGLFDYGNVCICNKS